jgi:hypothetical protein
MCLPGCVCARLRLDLNLIPMARCMPPGIAPFYLQCVREAPTAVECAGGSSSSSDVSLAVSRCWCEWCWRHVLFVLRRLSSLMLWRFMLLLCLLVVCSFAPCVTGGGSVVWALSACYLYLSLEGCCELLDRLAGALHALLACACCRTARSSHAGGVYTSTGAYEPRTHSAPFELVCCDCGVAARRAQARRLVCCT